LSTTFIHGRQVPSERGMVYIEWGEVPGEERKPADDKGADDDAERPCGLVFTP